MLKANDQVMMRKPLRNKTTLIEMGTVLSVDGKTAIVSFDGPQGTMTRVRRTVSVDQLEPVSNLIGNRKRISPAR